MRFIFVAVLLVCFQQNVPGQAIANPKTRAEKVGALTDDVKSSHSSKKDDRIATKEFNHAKYYPPTQIPDRIALTFSGDPATSISVVWRTSKLEAEPIVQYALATSGPEFVVNSKTIKATTEKLDFRILDSYYHTATISDLLPNTQYLYRVGDGSKFSEWSEFKTAQQKDQAFSFVYFGDAQNAIKAAWSRVVRRGFREMPNASFFLHAGDLINSSNSDNEWGEWFYAAGWINRSIPIVAVPGNHEYGKGGLSRHWKPSFEFPKNGPEGMQDSVYFFDYQGVRFIALDTNREIEKQAKWLDTVLKDNHSNWTILTGHHPFYSPAKKRNNPKLRELFAPVFKKYRIDLCLQGHDHSYSRTFQTELKKEMDETASKHVKNGTVFAVSVSGPKMYTVDKKTVMQRVAEGTQLYQLITVEKNKIRYKALTASGELYDAFELNRDGENVTIVDQTPITPERRFDNIKFGK